MTIRNVILGLGSVFLSCGLFNFLIVTRLSTHPYSTYMALTTFIPLFFLAALAYIVGFLDHYTRKRSTMKERNTVKPLKSQFLKYADPFWGLHIGAFSIPVLFAIQLNQVYFSRFDSGNLTFIFGIPSPMFYSVIGGATVGIFVLLINYILSARLSD
jgi:hypothetical protein